LKTKAVRTKYVAELAMVIKSGRSGASLHDAHVSKLFWFKEA